MAHNFWLSMIVLSTEMGTGVHIRVVNLSPWYVIFKGNVEKCYWFIDTMPCKGLGFEVEASFLL